MSSSTFPTPEPAALSGFPPEHCRVAACAVGGDDGYVLLDTRLEGGRYLYGVNVHREGDGWRPGSDGNGPGWTLTDREGELGTLVVWDEAPAGADQVTVEFAGEVREAPVTDGVYLLAWWRVPAPDSHPRVAGFSAAGRPLPGEAERLAAINAGWARLEQAMRGRDEA
jgi:hypothetical protein